MTFTEWLLSTTLYNKSADTSDGVYKFAKLVDSDINWPMPNSLEDLQKYLEKAKDTATSLWHEHEGLAFVSRLAWDDYNKHTGVNNGIVTEAHTDNT